MTPTEMVEQVRLAALAGLLGAGGVFLVWFVLVSILWGLFDKDER